MHACLHAHNGTSATENTTAHNANRLGMTFDLSSIFEYFGVLKQLLDFSADTNLFRHFFRSHRQMNERMKEQSIGDSSKEKRKKTTKWNSVANCHWDNYNNSKQFGRKISQSNPIWFGINTLVTKPPKNSHSTDFRSMETHSSQLIHMQIQIDQVFWIQCNISQSFEWWRAVVLQ